jgi:DNA-binding CsgD family transcriptional regulator
VDRGDALLSPGATRSLIARFPTHPDPEDSGYPQRLAALTDRERQVLALVATGMSNDEIGARLVLSPATAKTHMNRATMKLGARDRAQLVVIAYRSGLVRPHTD